MTFFSRPNDDAVGSFHYGLGLVEFTLSDPAHALIKDLFEGRSPSFGEIDDERLEVLAYEATSLVHEMRHFFDLFGTAGGCALFITRISILKQFAAVCTAMAGDNAPWRLPIEIFAAAADCPPNTRAFVRRARAFEVASQVYLAPFAPLEVEGHLSDLTVEVPFQGGGAVDAFPVRMFRVAGEGRPVPRTVLYPLGVETLLEGNAHAIARTFVERSFPKRIAQRFTQNVWTMDVSDRAARDRRAAETIKPYMVTDLLITRFLKERGFDTFDRDAVLAATDRTLATCTLRVEEQVPGTTKVEIERAGAVLVDVLNHEEVKSLAKGLVEASADLTAAYRNFLRVIERLPDWTTIPDDLSPSSSIAIWEAYMARTFIVPLLRERLATDDKAFTTYDGFLALLPKIGLPPARVANGRLMLNVMPARVQQAWWHQMMLGDLMRQMIAGGELVLCPRAIAPEDTIPGISTTNLAFEKQCAAHIKLGCGTFQPGRTSLAPRCLFEDSLRVSALRR